MIKDKEYEQQLFQERKGLNQDDVEKILKRNLFDGRELNL